MSKKQLEKYFWKAHKEERHYVKISKLFQWSITSVVNGVFKTLKEIHREQK